LRNRGLQQYRYMLVIFSFMFGHRHYGRPSHAQKVPGMIRN
jgi:hypothetical protein